MNDVDVAFTEFLQACKAIGLEPQVALWEKRVELEVRQALRVIPNDFLPRTRYSDFIKEVTGAADPNLVAQVVEYATRRGFSSQTKISLEERQNYRCALCGVGFWTSPASQVDHIQPLARRGANSLENLQLLCAKCNSGKSSLRSWVAGNPYFLEGDTLSPRLRFCVLTRHGGVCSVDGCGESHLSGHMHVTPLVPVHRGGRFIFDNLKVLCQAHFDHERRMEEASARAALGRSAGFGFNDTGGW